MNTENTCCCCCGDDENKNFNKKNEFVEKFIQLLKDTPLTVNVSSRQVGIYGRLIKMLEDAPRTLSMKDVRQRFIQAEDDMRCPCGEERGCTGYITIFDGLWIQLRHLLNQELNYFYPCECEKEENEDENIYCWEYNEYFDENSKKYYDGMVDLGYMDEAYQWTDKAKYYIKAAWIDLFGEKMNIRDRWAWGKRVWNMARKLNRRDYDQLPLKYQRKINEIAEMFKD